MSQPSKTADKPITVTLASFWRKLAAWVYDLLGAIAVFILALLVGYIVISLVSILLESSDNLSNQLSNNPLWIFYLAASVQYYYVWCWVKGGQTVGMRAWHLKLCKPDGQLLSWKEAYYRSFLSLGGVAQVWSLIDKENRGAQDIPFNSRIILLPKNFYKPT